jgi:gamma-glutamylcyclotransferase (GGCT)/AIG2-like uncharacterized protein YtfP
VKQLVFVYGTLMSGFANNGLLANSRLFATRARTIPEYTLVDLGFFPGLLAEGSGQVIGELYEINDATLNQLDALEAVPILYKRQRVKLVGDRSVWGYFLNKENINLEEGEELEIISSGNWRRHVRRKVGRI